MAIKLVEPFDAAEFITDRESQAELLAEAFHSGDRAYIAHALGIVARAQGGLTKLASDTDLQRPALHRALGRDGNPTLDTLLKVMAALSMELTVTVPAREAPCVSDNIYDFFKYRDLKISAADLPRSQQHA